METTTEWFTTIDESDRKTLLNYMHTIRRMPDDEELRLLLDELLGCLEREHDALKKGEIVGTQIEELEGFFAVKMLDGKQRRIDAGFRTENSFHECFGDLRRGGVADHIGIEKRALRVGNLIYMLGDQAGPYPFEPKSLVEAQRQALAKLTPEERAALRVLGVDE